MAELMSDYSRQVIKDAILRNIEKYGRSVMSVVAARMTFEFRPMEAKLVEDVFTIVPELDELKEFCVENNIAYEFNHEHYEIRFRTLGKDNQST